MMKYIFALALFAVAYAEVKVVHLPRAPAPAYEKADISPVLVSDEVISAVKVAHPVWRDDLRAEDVDAFKVLVVDAPLAPAPEARQPIPSSVQIADAAQPVVETVRVAEPHLPGKQYPNHLWR